jgi:protein TonB
MADRAPRTSPNARFLRGDALAGNGHGSSIESALSVSVVAHAFGFLLLALAIGRLPHDAPRSTVVSNTAAQIVLLPEPGVLRGGGGSGSDQPEPARKTELSGRDALTVPALSRAAALTDTSTIDIQIPAVPLMSDVRELPGVATTLSPVPMDSQGPGSGDRGGPGSGSGSGPGDGPGVGPGRGGGSGGDNYQIGGGVASPRLIAETKPKYTAQAMRARIEGIVRLEAIVLPDGSVGRVRVVGSLDRTFGLDDEAVSAVKQWRFAPGTLGGRAIPVPVNIELAFTLR